uniref:Uncharacterized protein n=1 Tax=Acrobeloides nanus TaxID=290746 RepID=A0A914EBE4_9BILA
MPSQKLVGDVVMFIVIKSTTELKLKSMIYIPSRAVPIFYENLVKIFNEYEKLPNKLDSEPTVDHAISTSQAISRRTSAIVNDRHRSKYANELVGKRLTRNERTQIAKEEKEFIEENRKDWMKPKESGKEILEEAVDPIKLKRDKARARLIEQLKAQEEKKRIKLAREKTREAKQKLWAMTYEAKRLGWKPPELRNPKPPKVRWFQKLVIRTFILNRKRFFVNLIRLNKDQSKIIVHLSKYDNYTNKKSHLHLSIDGAKNLLSKLKEVIEVIEKGRKESDDEKCEYKSSFLAKMRSKNGDKEVEYNVRLKTINEENKLNTYLVVSYSLENDKNGITIRDNAIPNIKKAIEELLSKYAELKPTEALRNENV